jgi:hypothetical protein
MRYGWRSSSTSCLAVCYSMKVVYDDRAFFIWPYSAGHLQTMHVAVNLTTRCRLDYLALHLGGVLQLSFFFFSNTYKNQVP